MSFRKMSFYCDNCRSKIIFETEHPMQHPFFDCFCGGRMEHINCEKKEGNVNGTSPNES
jgi:hypothetical protein